MASRSSLLRVSHYYRSYSPNKKLGCVRRRWPHSHIALSHICDNQTRHANLDCLKQYRAFSSTKNGKNENDEKEVNKKHSIKEAWRSDWREKVLASHRELQDSAKVRQKQAKNELESTNNTLKNVQRALIGNLCIAIAKLGAWVSCGSSAMLSEFVHSLVDCGNQALLLIGLRQSGIVADRRHPYGYGKSIYFWSLVSALGTFWLGAGVSMRHSIEELFDPSLCDITWHVWGVLGFSLAVDGWVFGKTLQTLQETQPPNKSLFQHLIKIRDPATLAVLLEDGAACAGIVIASAGLGLTHATGLTIYDGLAGVSISLLLGGMGLMLARMNQHFLLGQTVDADTLAGIENILLRQPAIDNVHSVKSQWNGPDSFSYKAEVDFDGTYLAAKLLPRYQKEFLAAQDSLDQELRVLLSWYAEDVMRTVERGEFSYADKVLLLLMIYARGVYDDLYFASNIEKRCDISKMKSRWNIQAQRSLSLNLIVRIQIDLQLMMERRAHLNGLKLKSLIEC